MISVSITSNYTQARAKLKSIQEDVTAKATVATLNRTIDKGKTEMVRGITSEFALRAADVRPRLGVRRASRKDKTFQAMLEAFNARGGRRSINVILFAERKVTLAEGRRRARAGTQSNVFVQIRRGHGRKMIPRSWIMTANGGTFVAQRTGPTKVEMRSVRTGDIAQWFNTKRINARVVDRMEREYVIEFERAAAYFARMT